MDMNIQKYMAFVRTVEYGSFTKAAEMLNYSQSGISRMINDLEKDLKRFFWNRINYLWFYLKITHLQIANISR